MGVTSPENGEISLSEQVRQVIALLVGAAWKAAYEVYAHAAVGEKAGFDEQTIISLVAGQKQGSLATHERVAFDFTQRLAAQHQLDAELYERTFTAFGEKGVVDMI